MSGRLSSTRRSAAVLVALWAGWLGGCNACGDRFIAELTTASRSVDRDFSAAMHTWQKAEPGARFEMGDGLRTGASANAMLSLPHGGRLLIKSDTLMRFTRSLAKGAEGRRIEVEQGELTVETGELQMGISTTRGVVMLESGSEVRVRAQENKIRFDVLVGRAEFAGDGPPMAAQAGRGFELDILKPSAEPATPPSDPSSAPMPEPNSPEMEPAAGMEGGKPGGTLLRDMTFQESPPQISFTLPAGETATIHDPAPPTDLRMTVARCPGLAVLEFDRGNRRFDALRVRGTSELRARVPRGNYRYRVRCVRNGRVEMPPVSAGRLNVARDAATRPLPVKPVTITADADGRRYTVSYQNRLPVITLRWPEPPAASQFTLKVQPEHGAAFSVQSSRPSVTLAAGRLPEGLHGFWFETAGKRSEQGLLRVAFDYKARTAYLTLPVDGQRLQGGTARFSGGTLLGSLVHLQGVAMKLDSQGRFATEIPVPADVEGLAVRVQHPSTGIHYYVRHVSPTPSNNGR
jgi:hypothetical protein